MSEKSIRNRTIVFVLLVVGVVAGIAAPKIVKWRRASHIRAKWAAIFETEEAMLWERYRMTGRLYRNSPDSLDWKEGLGLLGYQSIGPGFAELYEAAFLLQMEVSVLDPVWMREQIHRAIETRSGRNDFLLHSSLFALPSLVERQVVDEDTIARLVGSGDEYAQYIALTIVDEVPEWFSEGSSGGLPFTDENRPGFDSDRIREIFENATWTELEGTEEIRRRILERGERS